MCIGFPSLGRPSACVGDGYRHLETIEKLDTETPVTCKLFLFVSGRAWLLTLWAMFMISAAKYC